MLFSLRKQSDIVELVYDSDNGIKADQMGNAIIGMQLCFSEIGKLIEAGGLDLVVLPIEKGSLKTKFKLIGYSVAGVGIIVGIFSDSLDIIQRLGLKKVFNPDQEVLKQITDPRVLGVCSSKKFAEGSQKIVAPLSESVNNLEVKYDNEGITIDCENKEKFFEDTEDEIIFPELKNGEVVKLAGEIIRLNKEYNDLGFKYKDRTLKCFPKDLNENIVQFHDFLEAEQVIIEGEIFRIEEKEMPQIQIISIEKINSPKQQIIILEKKKQR